MTGNNTDSGLSYMRDKAAIAGIRETEFSFDSGSTEWQLACEAIKAACDDADSKISATGRASPMEVAVQPLR